MSQILQAAVTISAKDETGSAFAAVASKMGALSRQMSAIAPAMTSAGKAMMAAQANVKALEQAYGKSIGEVQKWARRQAEARAEVERTRQVMQNASKVTADMRQAYQAAQYASNAATQGYRNQAQAVSELRSQLERARSSMSGLTAATERERQVSRSGVPLIPRRTIPQPWGPGVAHPTPGRRRLRDAVNDLATDATVGYGVYHVARDAIAAGADLESERVRMRAAGIPEAEIGTADTQAAELSQRYPNVSRAHVLRAYRETRSVLLHPEETPHMMDAIIATKSAMEVIDPSGRLAEGLQWAIKSAEMQGLANDPARFRSFLDSFIRAQQVMGNTITPEMQYLIAKQLKASAPSLSDRFRSTTLLSLGQELGERAGTGINMAVKELDSGFVGQRQAAKQFVALGLAQLSDFDVTKSGEIKGLRPGRSIAFANEFRHDPDKAIYEHLLPALEGHGYHTLDEMSPIIRRLFPNSNAADVVMKMIQQRASIENHAQQFPHSLGMAAAPTNLTDPTVAVKGFTTSLENLNAAVTGPLMPQIAQGLNTLTNAINKASQTLLQNPELRHPVQSTLLGGSIGSLFGGLTGAFRGGISGLFGGALSGLWRGVAAGLAWEGTKFLTGWGSHLQRPGEGADTNIFGYPNPQPTYWGQPLSEINRPSEAPRPPGSLNMVQPSFAGAINPDWYVRSYARLPPAGVINRGMDLFPDHGMHALANVTVPEPRIASVNVAGEATVHIEQGELRVTLNTEMLRAEIGRQVREATANLPLRQTSSANLTGPGSTGRSSTDAMAPHNVGRGDR